jgi:hypothetical protein
MIVGITRGGETIHASFSAFLCFIYLFSVPLYLAAQVSEGALPQLESNRNTIEIARGAADIDRIRRSENK